VTKISQLIEEGTTITAYCTVDCGHRADLDLEALGKAYGPDFDLNHYTIAHKLKCTKCGRLGVTIRHHQQYRTGIKFDTHGKLMG
jgi:hypothetical protein